MRPMSPCDIDCSQSLFYHILYIRILTAKQARLRVTGTSFCQVYRVDKKPKSFRKHFLIENEDPCLAYA